jgi:hypothetical protein
LSVPFAVVLGAVGACEHGASIDGSATEAALTFPAEQNELGISQWQVTLLAADASTPVGTNRICGLTAAGSPAFCIKDPPGAAAEYFAAGPSGELAVRASINDDGDVTGDPDGFATLQLAQSAFAADAGTQQATKADYFGGIVGTPGGTNIGASESYPSNWASHWTTAVPGYDSGDWLCGHYEQQLSSYSQYIANYCAVSPLGNPSWVEQAMCKSIQGGHPYCTRQLVQQAIELQRRLCSSNCPLTGLRSSFCGSNYFGSVAPVTNTSTYDSSYWGGWGDQYCPRYINNPPSQPYFGSTYTSWWYYVVYQPSGYSRSSWYVQPGYSFDFTRSCFVPYSGGGYRNMRNLRCHHTDLGPGAQIIRSSVSEPFDSSGLLNPNAGQVQGLCTGPNGVSWGSACVTSPPFYNQAAGSF